MSSAKQQKQPASEGMKVSDLAPSQLNPRKILDERLRLLGQSMREYGDLSGVIYNVRTKRLVGGHQRIKHLDPDWPITKAPHTDDKGTVAVGHIETPDGKWSYREVDWDERREIAANIAANKHGGEFDYPMLKDLIVEIDDGTFDLSLLGFHELELKSLFTDLRPTPLPDSGVEGDAVDTPRIIIILDDPTRRDRIFALLGVDGSKITYKASELEVDMGEAVAGEAEE
jgi:hypothetical protein